MTEHPQSKFTVSDASGRKTPQYPLPRNPFLLIKMIIPVGAQDAAHRIEAESSLLHKDGSYGFGTTLLVWKRRQPSMLQVWHQDHGMCVIVISSYPFPAKQSLRQPRLSGGTFADQLGLTSTTPKREEACHHHRFIIDGMGFSVLLSG